MVDTDTDSEPESEQVIQNVLWNPLTPRSDEQVTSPYNIKTLSSKQVITVISGRLPAGNLLILHEIRATAGNREVRVMWQF